MAQDSSHEDNQSVAMPSVKPMLRKMLIKDTMLLMMPDKNSGTKTTIDFLGNLGRPSNLNVFFEEDAEEKIDFFVM